MASELSCFIDGVEVALDTLEEIANVAPDAIDENYGEAEREQG